MKLLLSATIFFAFLKITLDIPSPVGRALFLSFFF